MIEMKFESLANEILFDLLEYLTAIDVLQAFRYLNIRFNNILLRYFRYYRLDFRCTSKHEFDRFMQTYFPWILDRTKSLYLTNADETPGQIQYFFSHGYTLSQFTCLQSLSISHLHSKQTMLELISELAHLPLLFSLNFIECYFHFNEEETRYLLTSIFSLTKLKQCRLCVDFGLYRLYLPVTLAISSSSLEQLYLAGSTNLRELAGIFHHAPFLQHLRLRFNDNSTNGEFAHVVPSLVTLNILVRDSSNTMMNLLKNMPNLYRLKIETQSTNFDGIAWEYLISSCLMNLKIFQLKMLITVDNMETEKKQVDALLNSFRSRFWLQERKWFVRCHWDTPHSSKPIYLYTLPYAFANCDSFINMKCQSTCLNDNLYCSYDSVCSSNCSNSLRTYFDSYPVCFNRLRHLMITLPMHDSFWLNIPNFDHLISLNISFEDVDQQFQLQQLLDKAPRLYSLISSDRFTTEELLKKPPHTSLRRLDFQKNNQESNKQWFNTKQCHTLCHSILAIQCEVLFINITKCTDIFELVNNMPRLRALNVQCQDDTYHDRSNEDDTFIEWLAFCLPSSYMIRRHTSSKKIIQLWI